MQGKTGILPRLLPRKQPLRGWQHCSLIVPDSSFLPTAVAASRERIAAYCRLTAQESLRRGRCGGLARGRIG